MFDNFQYTVWQVNADGSKFLVITYPSSTTTYAQVMTNIATLPSGQTYSLEQFDGSISTILF